MQIVSVINTVDGFPYKSKETELVILSDIHSGNSFTMPLIELCLTATDHWLLFVHINENRFTALQCPAHISHLQEFPIYFWIYVGILACYVYGLWNEQYVRFELLYFSTLLSTQSVIFRSLFDLQCAIALIFKKSAEKQRNNNLVQ